MLHFEMCDYLELGVKTFKPQGMHPIDVDIIIIIKPPT